MLKSEIVEVLVNSMTLRWYKEKGYEVPTKEVQLYCKSKSGERIKNGTKHRVPEGTKILVNVNDLPPSSGQIIEFICESCGETGTTTWSAYKKKQTNKCRLCQSKLLKDTGSHGYWVKKLIADNPNAKCDISGETDKRFLVLHHLDSRSSGGKDEEENYVILSANYHHAFHQWNGGTNIPCTREQYCKFKQQETDLQAEDWTIIL
jgi:hypothetical protein